MLALALIAVFGILSCAKNDDSNSYVIDIDGGIQYLAGVDGGTFWIE